MPKLKFSLETNKIRSRVESTIDIDQDDWDEMDINEKEQYAYDIFQDIMLFRLGEWNWEEVD